MRIWVTRTAPDNEATASRLKALGHDVVSVPVLGVRPSEAEPLGALPDAIVFTSRNGVRHHPAHPALFRVPVFAVGHATAEAAKIAGYDVVRSADGDVRDLQRLILEKLPPPARLVHFSARDVAGNLESFLRRFGYLVERRVVYTAHAVAIRWLLGVRTSLSSIDGIVVHSPRAAERVARVLAGTSWRGKIWCLSEACAFRLAGVSNIDLRFALRPDEAALIDMVGHHSVIRMPCRVSLRVVAAGSGGAFRPYASSPANDNEELRDDNGDFDKDPPPAA